MSKQPPNGLTADEWRDMRRAADKVDMVVGDIFNGRRPIDAKSFIEVLEGLETIQSTINLVIGQPKDGE